MFIFNPSRRCDEKLCHTCAEVHRKLKATKNHKTVKVGSTEAGTLVQMWKENPPLCQEHTRETVEYYCIPCSKGVCKSCEVLHESHKEKMEKVNTISTKMRKVISDKSVDIAEKQKEWKTKEKQNEEIYNMSMDNIASVGNLVEEKAEQLHRQIDAGRDLLIGKLNDLKTRHQLELVRARDTVDGELQKISRFMKISQDISIKSDVASLISYYPEWSKRKQALLSNRVTDDLRLVRVHLTDSFWEQEYISSENFIGELSVDPSEMNAVDNWAEELSRSETNLQQHSTRIWTKHARTLITWIFFTSDRSWIYKRVVCLFSFSF